jgi:sensor histidine kinase YesM
LSYSIAVASTVPVTLLATSATQQLYLSIFGLPLATPNLLWRTTIAGGFFMDVYVAFGVLVFTNQRTADRMLERFRSSELRRAQLERQLVESRLATAEAQIDPAMLFDALGAIKLGYMRGEERAEAQLNELIQTLRTALARTVNAPESPSQAQA